MKITWISAILSILAVSVLEIPLFSSGTIKQFKLGSGLTLHLAVDSQWNCSFLKKENKESEFYITNNLNKKEKCRIYVIPAEKNPTDDDLISIMKMNGAALLKKSVEKEFTFTPLPGGNGRYYILTDSSPKPGEAVLISRGAVSSGRHLVLFTFLFDQSDSPFFQSLLNTISSIKITPPE